MPKISVIIPIHGTERYVEKCVRSVMDQTLKDIEIICIDDCSPDNSAAIVEQLAATDDRIRLIRHERNLGLGGARNTGISEARAPYLASVDSDDYIRPEMMEKLWEGTGGGIADVVVCGVIFIDSHARPLGPRISPQPGRHMNTEDQIDIFNLFNPSFWNKLWRTSLFVDNDIRFPEQCYYEDLATTPRVLHYASDIRVISGDYYQYLIREESITNTSSPRHIMDYFRVYDILDNFLKQEGLQSRYEKEFVKKVGNSLSYHAAGVISSNMEEEQKQKYLRNMLIMKLGYLEYRNQFHEVDTATLQRMLKTSTCWDDVNLLDLPR
ncbi:glycosyltransferase family 2 protein [Thalassovita sp.]|uniref:glycosyltransferase family 2 protein n=1 Tax=Thalassovita sp. TaxID=1979401 RepID=UPI002B279EE8|nr:glycosyltransferase family 2 protein [Thalassovita sp.]